MKKKIIIGIVGLVAVILVLVGVKIFTQVNYYSQVETQYQTTIEQLGMTSGDLTTEKATFLDKIMLANIGSTEGKPYYKGMAFIQLTQPNMLHVLAFNNDQDAEKYFNDLIADESDSNLQTLDSDYNQHVCLRTVQEDDNGMKTTNYLELVRDGKIVVMAISFDNDQAKAQSIIKTFFDNK